MTPTSPRFFVLVSSCLAALTLVACAGGEPIGPHTTGTGGTSPAGDAGTTGAGSTAGTAGPGTAGTIGTAGTFGPGTAGTIGSAGTFGPGTAGTNVAGTTGSTGGAAGTNGPGTAGTAGTGRGGTTGTAGTIGRGGTTGTAGTIGRGGTTGTAGTTGRGGTTGTAGTTGTGGAVTIDCNAMLPTSGGTAHTSSNQQGTAGGLSWSVWTNSGPGTITTYSVPAFSASWNGSGDFLARIGLQWGNGMSVSALGKVVATYTETKSGSGGGYSYIGMYGWSTNPCVEWYIVNDRYGTLPVNPGNTTDKGLVTIDGGMYRLYTRNTTGTGGSRCSGVSQWLQFYSIRTTAQTCGTITVSDHFAAWAAAGMQLGAVLEASILVETGGGTGSINFPIANVVRTAP